MAVKRGSSHKKRYKLRSFENRVLRRTLVVKSMKTIADDLSNSCISPYIIRTDRHVALVLNEKCVELLVKMVKGNCHLQDLMVSRNTKNFFPS